jgi:L-rhamnose mutarotase
MGIFSDYVDAYPDLVTGYANSGIPNYTAYVDNNSDLLAAYLATGADNYDAYVRNNADLENAYQNRIDSKKNWNRAQWGQWHVQNRPAQDTRPVPKDPPTQTKEAWGKTHADTYKNRPVPKNVLPKEQWGANHWNNSGKTETRILPGGGQFSVQPDGTLSVNTESIGEKAQQKFKDFANRYNSSDGSNFQDIANGINNLGYNESTILSNSGVVQNLVNAYYGKVPKWDPTSNKAYQPPMGAFDPSYYMTTQQGKDAFNQWQKELGGTISIGGKLYENVSLVGRYDQNTFLQYNYAVVNGKSERGNAVTKAEQAEEYKEVPVTDAQYQQYRDQVMGLGSYSNLKEWEAAQDPEFLKQWISSLSPEDAEDRASGYLAIPSITQIPESLRTQAKMSRGETILEGKLSSVLGPKEQEAADKFRSLTVDTFNETLKEYKKQRAKEQEYDFYSGMSGFSEIFSMNEELANSLLGDSGVGGILSLGGQDQEKAEDSLEKQFSSITGIPSRSNSVYNWQKWFDETLTKRYEEGASFSDWQDASKQYVVDKEFAEDYIKRYLNPRFNTSRSMSEFMSYMDVTQGEENIFQTQSALSSLKNMADLRAKQWLDTIKTSGASGFDSEFYFNPSGGDVSTDQHAIQTTKVNEDWETAKKNGEQVVPGTNPPSTWNQLAYLYGYNVNDKAQFAKLHYQVYGIHQGFDPARDKLSLNSAQSFIDENILPAIANEKVNLGSATFLNFVTPREYADKMLEGIDPTQNKPEWEKILESMGLSGKDMGVEEVKSYIEEAFQTGEATKIREAIKYLNEKKEQVTQEKLGVDYIERAEDTAGRDNPNETELYSVFKNAGFNGTEDDFYNEFMPDVNREDMELLTQATKGLTEGSVFSGLSSSDPFEALGSVETLFADEETSKETENKTSSSTEDKSYFSLYDDEDTEDTVTAKSKSGQGFLGSFTSAFKGFTPKY